MSRTVRRSHRCRCPWPRSTGVALAILLTVILCMSLVQQYSDSLPDYPPECTLKDLGFDIIPHLGVDWMTQTTWNSLADVWVGVSTIIFFLLVIFALDDPMLVLTRFFHCMSYNYFIRTLTLALTRYPRLPFKRANYSEPNVFWGAILIMLGIRATATDMMMSGHTMLWITMSCFVTRYSKFSAWSALFWLFNVVGILSLIAVREHYSADVVVAVVIALSTFLVYHLLLDAEFIRFYVPGFKVETTRMDGLNVYLPAILEDSRGNIIRVGATGKDTPLVVPGASVRKNARGELMVRTEEHHAHNRYQLISLLRWLDGEKYK